MDKGYLIDRAKGRDPDAFTEPMQSYMQDMYRVALAILMNDEDAADAGNFGYTDESMSTYESVFALDRVIDADQVESILLQKNYPKTDADGGSHYEEKDFFVIPLR